MVLAELGQQISEAIKKLQRAKVIDDNLIEEILKEICNHGQIPATGLPLRMPFRMPLGMPLRMPLILAFERDRSIVGVRYYSWTTFSLFSFGLKSTFRN